MKEDNSKDIVFKYIQQATRNRLVFCHTRVEGLSFVDIGRALSEGLANENLHSQMVAYTAEDILSDILSSPQIDSLIGPYVAIDNIGILFEPDLALNLESTLDSASTNKTVILCSDGSIQSNKFFFFQPGDNYLINLKDLSYIEIK